MLKWTNVDRLTLQTLPNRTTSAMGYLTVSTQQNYPGTGLLDCLSSVIDWLQVHISSDNLFLSQHYQTIKTLGYKFYNTKKTEPTQPMLTEVHDVIQHH